MRRPKRSGSLGYPSKRHVENAMDWIGRAGAEMDKAHRFAVEGKCAEALHAMIRGLEARGSALTERHAFARGDSARYERDYERAADDYSDKNRRAYDLFVSRCMIK